MKGGMVCQILKGGMVCQILKGGMVRYFIKCGHSFVITDYHIDKSNKTLPLAQYKYMSYSNTSYNESPSIKSLSSSINCICVALYLLIFSSTCLFLHSAHPYGCNM